jgi:Trypsin-like peptidase domain
MLWRVGRRLLVVFVLLATTGTINAACVDATQLAHTAVNIMRHFDDAQREAHPDLIGIRGTGWFLTPATIVTAEHVTAAMNLSMDEWKPLEIIDESGSQFIAARIQRLAGGPVERLAIIELQRTVAASQSATIRKEPLLPEEPVATLAYPAGIAHLVSGRFVRVGDEGKLEGMALLEMYEGENRLVIDHGASGAPVFDCTGRVVAVVTNVFTRTLNWSYHVIRISTAWGMPNVVSVPVQVLNDPSPSD